MEKYKPIACSIYDQLLIKVDAKQSVDIQYLDQNAKLKDFQGKIQDVYTENKAEYLKLENGESIRLDKLLAIDQEKL